MINAPKYSELMEAHVQINMGTFFDSTSRVDDLCLATSAKITDHYWNFGYKANSAELSGQDALKIEDAFRAIGRAPAIWQRQGLAEPFGWDRQSSEAWMWLDASAANETASQGPADFQVDALNVPTPEMIAVFNDAYSSDEPAGEVGYFLLPPEYGKAYSESSPRPGTILRHLRGRVRGRCVAVATVGVWNGIGGIYSVGTAHAERRRGYGKAISRAATQFAFEQGARGVVLQTAADSPVEAMYAALGYKRLCVGLLLAKHSGQ